MSIQQAIKSIFVFGAILIGLTNVFGQTAPTPTPQPIRAASFGLQTLDTGRTGRLSVVHAPPLTASPTTSASARYAVRADFDVYSVRTDGSVRFLRRISREATIAAGEGLTLDYSPTAGDGSVRVASTVYMQRLGETESPDTAPAISVSLEVRTRETTLFLLPGTIRGFNPQPDPPRELIVGSRFD
jgi:hypothetical protein